MKLHLCFVLNFLVLLSGVQVKALCSSKTSCGKCITDPICSWCMEVSNNIKTRCKTISENEKSCLANMTSNPVSKSYDRVRLDLNTSGAGVDAIHFQPQAVDVKLRAGVSHTVNITFRKLFDFPLDLYYVIDLSNSMQDDLQNLQNLGKRLVSQIKANVTENVNLGFGSFVDKVIMPFATDDQVWLSENCNGTCQPTFGFHHQLSITDDSSAFEKVVTDTKISANIDIPEGGFDALMQISVCQDIIKWRKGSLRVVLITTDAVPHQALDGKLIGILKPNDMKCHLTKINSSSDIYWYNESQYQDYPSIGQLMKVFQDHEIQSIFAVTKDVLSIYQNFPNILPNSFVDILKSDSSNIVDVISTSYDKIKSRFSLLPPTVPEQLDLKYRVKCPGSTSFTENSLNCLNVFIGDDVFYQFELSTKSCPNVTSQKDSIVIAASNIPDTVNITVEYICDCECESAPTINSEYCRGRGNLKCGVCDCNTGIAGKNCECVTEKTNEQLTMECTDSQPLEVGQGITPCHGRGECQCGVCNCTRGFTGKYCQCSDTGCPSGIDGICGGSNRGSCRNCYENLECVCNIQAGWFLDSQTNICRCNNQTCIGTGVSDTCSGRGTCQCDTCTCNDTNLWSGSYCDKCKNPLCSKIVGTCEGSEIRKCAICASGVFGSSACQTECASVGFKTVEVIPSCTACLVTSSASCAPCINFNSDIFTEVFCKTQNEQKCNIEYAIFWHNILQNYFVLAKQIDFKKDCPQAIDPVAIVLPVVGTIVFGGILALVIWKLMKIRYDRRKYLEFVKILETQKWMTESNPIHNKPTTRFENPNYVNYESVPASTKNEKVDESF